MSAETYQVYAILHEEHQYSQGGWQGRKTTAVSAESEYGAIKRFAANSVACIKDIAVIPGRKPQYDERRIEGHCKFDWAAVREVDEEGNIHHDWEYR